MNVFIIHSGSDVDVVSQKIKQLNQKKYISFTENEKVIPKLFIFVYIMILIFLAIALVRSRLS